MLTIQGTQLGQIKIAKVEKIGEKRLLISCMAKFHGEVKKKKNEEEEKKTNHTSYRTFSPESEFYLLVNENRFFIYKNE